MSFAFSQASNYQILHHIAIGGHFYPNKAYLNKNDVATGNSVIRGQLTVIGMLDMFCGPSGAGFLIIITSPIWAF